MPSSDRYACFLHEARRYEVISSDSKIRISLLPAEADILTCSPIDDLGFAALGLLDKYNGSAALISYKSDQKDSRMSFTMELREGGDVGFYSDRAIHTVQVNGEKFDFYQINGVVQIKTPATPCKISALSAT